MLSQEHVSGVSTYCKHTLGLVLRTALGQPTTEIDFKALHELRIVQ